jgi:hypothetical protein
MKVRLIRFSVAALAAFAAFTFSSTFAARAEGTARIQQADGTVNVYEDVKIQIIHNTLAMTTADGKGTLMIYRAACAYQGDIYVCLPTGATLVQGGSVNPINITRGTVYANLTGEMQQLSLSTMRLPAHSIMMALRTKRGTYVTLSGTIDKVKK